MNRELIIRAIESPTEEAIDALLEDDETVFAVDWREGDGDIVDYCESILQTGSLSAEYVDADNEAGIDLYIQYKNKRVKAPLVIGVEDRHITIVTLNKILSPDFEIRMCIDSSDGDTLLFIPLPCKVWRELEAFYGEKVAKRFYQLRDRPNVFTDELPFFD